MIFGNIHEESALNPHLKMLSLIRSLVLACQVTGLLYYSYGEDIGLPSSALAVTLTCFGLLTLYGWLRAYSTKPIGTAEFVLQLALEILVLTLLLYFAGGASNPFVSYFLVPVCIAATVLTRRYVFAITGMAILAYSLLIFFFVPIHAFMPHSAQGANLHLLGMWVNFVVSATLISYFVVQMAKTIALQREQMSQQREQQMENDRLISIATLAASTAHELGTPLNSIHLISQEIKEEALEESQKNLATQLNEQASICKKTLGKLVETANQNIQKTPINLPVEAFFRDLVDRWQLIHPEINITLDFSALDSSLLIYARPTLEPTVFNLLDNAFQVSPKSLDVILRSGQKIKLIIRDYGDGFSEKILQQLGSPFNSDREEGMGIGIYLAKSSIEQIGGSLEFSGWEHGTETTLNIPYLDGDETS